MHNWACNDIRMKKWFITENILKTWWLYKYEIKQCIIIIIGVNRYRYVYYIYLFFGFLTNNYQRFLQLSDKYFKFIAFSIYIYTLPHTYERSCTYVFSILFTGGSSGRIGKCKILYFKYTIIFCHMHNVITAIYCA